MVDVRAAHVNEADALGAVMWDAVHNAPSAYSPAQKEAWVPQLPNGAAWAARLGDQQIWVAEDAGEICGFVTLAGTYVDFAYVQASAQGRGVMRAMLAVLEAAARAQDAPRLWTHASVMAQPAFAALGFHVIRHETVARSGQTLARAEMEKVLT